MGVLERLRARREQLVTEARAVVDPAADMKRALSDDEQRRYDAAVDELDRLDERIKEVAGQEKRAADAAAVMDPYTRRRRPARDDGLCDSFRSMILEKNPAPIDVRWDQPRSVYQPGVERRDLVTTAPANMAGVSFYGRLVEHMVESSAVLRAGATLLTTDSGESMRVPRSTGLSTAGIVAEAAVIPDSDPALSSITLGAYKYGFLVQVSTEMVQDSGIDLEGYLAREAGQAIGLGLGNHLINGTGTGQPRGVLADATAGVTGPTGTATSFGAQGTAGQGTDLLYDLFGSVAEPYVMQPAAGWLLRNASLTTVRKLKTSAGEGVGTDFVTDGPAGASGSMIGKPAFIDPYVPAMAASAKSVLFGDWSRYFVRMVNGIRFERSNDYAFNSDLVTFRALLRADAAMVDPSAIKYFVHSAT